MADNFEEVFETVDGEVLQGQEQKQGGQKPAGVGFRKSFENTEEAQVVIETLEALGYGDNYEFQTTKKGTVVEITGLDSRQLAILQRKINVNNWSKMTCHVANSVTNFATDIADYALNGALAPCVGSVANAGLTTARVVGTAGVKAGAMVATSLIRNTRAAATEIYNSREIAECGAELKGLWSDISGHLFGSSGAQASSWEAF